MAAFDEGVQGDRTVQPTEAPSFFYKTPHGIETPKPFSAAAEAIKGATDAFKEGVEGMDKFMKDAVKDTTEAAAGKFGEDMVKSTQTVYGQVFPGKSDTVSADKSDVPDGLKDGLKQAENLKLARDQGGLPGHIREVQFQGDAYRLAQNLRQRFPGYRDIIDSTFEKVTGMSPTANAYVKQMLSDINETINKKDTSKTTALSHLWSHPELPNADVMFQLRQNDQVTDGQVMTFLNRGMNYKYQHETDEAALSRRNLNDKIKTELTVPIVANYVSASTHNSIQALLHKYFPDDDALKNADDAKWQQFGQELNLLKGTLFNDYNEQFRTKVQGVPGARDLLGDNFHKTRDDNMGELTQWQNIVNDPQHGMAYAMKHAAEAFQAKNYYNTMISKTPTAQLFQLWDLGHHFGGPNAVQLTPMIELNNKFSKDGKTVPDINELTTLLGSAGSNANVGGISGITQTLKTIRDANNGHSPESLALYPSMVANAITNSNATPQEKANLLNHTFDPKEKGWIGKINDDYLDPKTGQRVYGRHAVALQFATPKMVTEVKNSTDPQGWQKFVDFHKDAFQHDTAGNDLDKLKGLQLVRGMNLKLHLEDNKPSWVEIVPGGNKGQMWERSYGSSPSTDPAVLQNTVTNLNRAIHALHNVLGSEETNAFFKKTLYERGVDTSSAERVKEGNAAVSLLLSIGAAGNKVEQTKGQVPDTSSNDMSVMNMLRRNQPGFFPQSADNPKGFPQSGLRTSESAKKLWENLKEGGMALGTSLGNEVGLQVNKAAENYKKAFSSPDSVIDPYKNVGK